MKTKTITLPNLELLVVELPEGAIDPTVTMGYITARVPNHTDCVHDDWVKKLDVDGDWKHLGAVGDLSEEQAVQIVEKIEYPWLEGEYCYPDYVVYGKSGFKAFDTALESLHSLLEANGVVFENRYDKSLHSAVSKSIENTYESKLQEAEIFREAQKQVWDKSRTHLFIKQK